MSRNKVLHAFSWAVSVTSLFVITLSAGITALIVGDWIALKTGNLPLSWVVGFFVFFGFLASLGTGIGIWIWLKAPTEYEIDEVKVLAELASSERE